MPNEKSDSYEGCKTFFFVPDLSIMPEDFVSSFFAQGFEAYYVMDDKHLDLESKARVILRLFSEVIFFFNVERRIGDLEWPAFMRHLREEHGDSLRIGVLSEKRIGENAIAELRQKYLYDIGVCGGFIPLEYHKSRNLDLLTEVLAANDARGRRNSLRAICGETSSLNFTRRGSTYRAQVGDVSLSHFSCIFEGPDPGLEMYEKVENIQLKLGGIICTVNGVVFARREVAGSIFYVFVFRNSRDRNGLDAEMHSKVNLFIQRHFETSVRSTLARGFGEEIAARRGLGLPHGSTRTDSPAILAP